jgi:mono/diheme cytochrome c family protein
MTVLRTLTGGALLPMLAALAPSSAWAQDTVDRMLVTDQVYTGWKYFQVYCARCHGDDALGSMLAPDLTYAVTEAGGITADSFKVVVRRGSSRPSTAPDQRMRGFENLLEPAQVDAVYAYLRARSDRSLGQGRPHRAPTAP